jgi:uncharacterized protein (TIGR03083 family)
VADEGGSTDVFQAAADRRRSVADLLESLDGAQLATPSLCTGWDVLTVGAHLADSLAPTAVRELLVGLVRSGGRLHRANDRAAHRAARRPVSETVALLRQRAESRAVPPVTGPRAPLTEVLVHEGDMRIPLGLPYDPGPDAVRIALQFVTDGRPVGFVPRNRLRGLRLTATDLDWSWGDGQEIRGRGIDLLMAGCGRSTVLPQLDGPGRGPLAAKLPS